VPGDVARRRLPQVDLGTARAEPLGEQPLQGGLVARRVVDARPARGVERDQLTGERNQLVAPRGDALDQGLLVGVKRGRVERAQVSGSSSSPAP
jgi:hypothetical protein